MPLLSSQWATKEHVLHWLHWLRAMGEDNYCQSSPRSFNTICLPRIAFLITNQRKATSICALDLLQIIFHLGEMEGGNFILPLIHNRLLEDFFSSSSFPLKLGWVRKERGNLMPPPTCHVKEIWSQYHEEQGELSMSAITCQFVYHEHTTSILRKPWVVAHALHSASPL